MKINVEFALKYIRFAPNEKQRFFDSLNNDEKVRLTFAVKNLYDELLESKKITHAGINKLCIVFGRKLDGQMVDFSDDIAMR